MTLNEAIKHAKEVAEANEERLTNGFYKQGSRAEKECRQCAIEHKKLAYWLEDYKKLRVDMALKEGELPEECREALECGLEHAENCAEFYVEVAEMMSRIQKRMQQDDEYARKLRERHRALFRKEENVSNESDSN